MGLLSFLHGKTGRLIIHRMYGFGAAGVILGALFKLMHYPGAGAMLTAAMSIECVLFVISAFEPLPHDYNWSLVYPELGGEEGAAKSQNARPATGGNNFAGGGFNSNLNIDIDPEAGEQLKAGVNKLTNSFNQMANLTGVVEASNHLLGSITQTSTTMVAMNESAGMLTESYQRSVQSMGAVNSSHELFLQESKRVQNDYSRLHTEIEQLVGNVQTSTTETQKFSGQMANLNNSIGQLNSIYGSMLTAVNSVINK